MDLTLENVWVFNFKYGIRWLDCILSKMTQVRVRDCEFGIRLEKLAVGGTSITLDNCWVQNPGNNTGDGMRIYDHNYVTLINCAVDGFDTGEHLYSYHVLNSSGVSFVGCASERTKRSPWLIESSDAVVLNGCWSTAGDKDSWGATFAYVGTGAKNVNFIGCKDYLPGSATTSSITKDAAGSAPIMIGNTLTPSRGYNHEGTVIGVADNVVGVGLSSLEQGSVVITASDSVTTRKRITVNNANAISAANA